MLDFVQGDGGGKTATNEQQPAHQAHQEGGVRPSRLLFFFAHVTPPHKMKGK